MAGGTAERGRRIRRAVCGKNVPYEIRETGRGRCGGSCVFAKRSERRSG